MILESVNWLPRRTELKQVPGRVLGYYYHSNASMKICIQRPADKKSKLLRLTVEFSVNPGSGIRWEKPTACIRLTPPPFRRLECVKELHPRCAGQMHSLD